MNQFDGFGLDSLPIELRTFTGFIFHYDQKEWVVLGKHETVIKSDDRDIFYYLAKPLREDIPPSQYSDKLKIFDHEALERMLEQGEGIFIIPPNHALVGKPEDTCWWLLEGKYTSRIMVLNSRFTPTYNLACHIIGKSIEDFIIKSGPFTYKGASLELDKYPGSWDPLDF